MAAEPRRTRRAHFSDHDRITLLEDDADEFDEDGTRRDRRQAQLIAAAVMILISVCTAIITMFVTGLVKP